MRAMLEKIPVYESSSFAVKYGVGKCNVYPWHYHPEYEIAWVAYGHGMRYVGDEIGSFDSGELVMMGPNLPHVWKYDEVFHQGPESLESRVYVIHFKKDSFGAGFFDLPEMIGIQNLLARSKRGIIFKETTHKTLAPLLDGLVHASGGHKMGLLLQLLEKLSLWQEVTYLASPGYVNTFNQNDSERLKIIYDYALNHYREQINVGELAEQMNMSFTSLCRFIKSRTGRPFKQIVNEIRIGNACRLLLERDDTISQVCFACGYNNLSHFNRQFKAIKGMTPREFMKRYRKI